MLRHRLQDHAHAEGIEPAAAVLLGSRQRPQSGRLGLGGEAQEVLAGDLGRVRVEGLLEGDDLLLHESADLLAQQAQLLRKREAREHGHGCGA